MGSDLSTIHAAIALQAEIRPAETALQDRKGSMSYAELVGRADALASSLALDAEARVGICAKRCVNTAVAMLAVLRAGGACVPLDPAYPPDRRSYLASDSRCAVILTDGEHGAEMTAPGVETIDLRSVAPQGPAPSRDVHPDQLAMVLYTSGSTGQPKGTTITHRNVLALVHGHEALRHRPGDVVAHVLSSSFDAILLDLWGALIAGATCFLPPDDAASSPGHLLDAVAGAGVTTLPITSSLFHQLVELRPEAFRHLRTVWFGGEAADPAVAHRVTDGVELVHHYGPTECTSISTVHVVGLQDTARATLPIGKGLDSVQLHVLDEALRPVEPGDVGELLIGGPQVARGYLDRPGLTADRFLPDPFSDVAGARLYRTGDLVRQLSEGELQFEGRVDDQLKVRGFRVEPAEVAACLREVDGVHDVAVVAREDVPGQARLVAYTVGDAALEEQLRSAAARALPEHMRPTAYVFVDALPRLANQKIDVAALPAPAGRATAPDGAPTETERQLAELWRDVLDVPSVGPDDDFFALGGYSLLAARLAVRIEEALGAAVPLRAFFEARTLRELAAVVDGRSGGPSPATPTETPRTMSPGQRELWFLDRLRPGSSAYNSPMAFRITGPLDVGALQRALDEIVARHEVLRWSFPAREGRPDVAVASRSTVTLGIEDGPGADGDADLVAWAAQRREEPFDVGAGPLVRAHLLRVAPDDVALLVTVHHMVFDGWSFKIFVDELSALYAAFAQDRPDPLAPLALSYGDLVSRKEQRLQSGALDDQIRHWRETLAGAPPAVDLPAGDRHAERSTAVVAKSHISDDLGVFVQELALAGTATPFMTLLAALGLSLYTLAGAHDLVVASPNAGRRGAGAIEAIGYFIQLLPLRLTIDPQQSVGALLDRAEATAIAAFDNQDVPFERIVHELRPARTRNARSPYCQIVLNMVNLEMPVLTLEGARVARLDIPTPEARVPLAIIVTERGYGFELDVLGDPTLVAPDLVRELAAILPRALELVVRDREVDVGSAAEGLREGSSRREPMIS
jgi:amino acid adenylation domain-containing protein